MFAKTSEEKAAIGPLPGAANLAEAANVARLGDYALLYAFLFSLANFAVLCILLVCGMPLQGDFSALGFFRIVFWCAGIAYGLLAAYALSCLDSGTGRRCWLPGLQLTMTALVLVFLGIDHGDMTERLANVLLQIERTIVILDAAPLP